MKHHELIETALQNALVKMRAALGIGWSCAPLLVIEERAGISAYIAQRDELTLWVSRGSLDAIKRLQVASQVALDVNCALEWLILHELHHADLGHFKIIENRLSLNLVSRSKCQTKLLRKLPAEMTHKVAPCLELQADHDALELILDDYSAGEWDAIRMRVASIAAVMVLIEKIDVKNQIEPSSHPKAATRIFQLLGHVTEMWSIPAHAKIKARGEETIREKDLPSKDEIQTFSKEVILPTFWDAVALADVADAESIIADLGSPEEFFADIGRAKLGQWGELVTVGAKEWATLKDVNDLIMPLLEINQVVN